MAAHFTPEAMKFLRGLARNNDREWFEARREVYTRELKAPMLSLVDEISAGMAKFAPEHLRPSHKIIMRIYRDTRFSKDKRPYKKHLAAWWARRGMEKTSGAGFYLQVSPHEVMIAAGVFMPERAQLLALRQWMAAHHETYRATVQRVITRRGEAAGLTGGWDRIEEQALTRMPRGFAADHPAGELLRARNWGVRISLPAQIALEASLPAEIVRRFAQAAPLVDQLNGAILDTIPWPSRAPAAHSSREAPGTRCHLGAKTRENSP